MDYGTYGPHTGPVGYGKTPRKILNLVAIFLGVVLPWAVFVIVFACFSFSVHYKTPQLCTLISVLAFILVFYFGYSAASAA